MPEKKFTMGVSAGRKSSDDAFGSYHIEAWYEETFDSSMDTMNARAKVIGEAYKLLNENKAEYPKHVHITPKKKAPPTPPAASNV